MSSGSWLGTGKDAIGDLPGDMNAWDKLQLGWLNYDTAKAGDEVHAQAGRRRVQHQEQAGAGRHAARQGGHHRDRRRPPRAQTQWWSGSGDNLTNTLTRSRRPDRQVRRRRSPSRAGGTSRPTTTTSTPRCPPTAAPTGRRWTARRTAQPIPRDGSDKPALTGTVGAYKKLAYPLDAYAGKKIDLRFRYQTDGGVAQKGFAADAITVTADGAAALHRQRRDRRRRLDGEGLLPHRRVLHQRLPAVLHRREPAVRRRTTRPSRPARTTSASRQPVRPGSSTTRTRTAC